MAKKNKGDGYTAREVNDLVQQMRKTLLDNVTTELLTPLTEIRLLAEVLSDGIVKEPQVQQAYAQKIISESKRMEQMVNDLRELSDLQNGRRPCEKKTVRTIDIFGSVLTRHMLLFADTDVTLNTEHLNLDFIPFLYADPDKLIRLINILLDHSVRFAGQCGTVSIKSQFDARCVMFRIESGGFGMPEAELKNIFQEFYHSDSNEHGAVVNRLELAIAGQIAGTLGEKLWAECAVNGGTVFCFSVARADPAQQAS